MSDTPVIPLFKEFDFERFGKFKKTSGQQMCDHKDSVVFDGEIDELQCEKCLKKWTSFQYMWYWIENEKPPKEIWEHKNAIYYLNEEKKKLESEVEWLKKERRKLKLEITKLKKV